MNSLAANLPGGWATAAFGDFWGHAQNGCSARRGSGVPTVVLRLADVSTDGTIAETSLREIALPEAERAKYALRPGDLLAFRVNGSTHITGQVACYRGPRDYAFCDHFIRIRLTPGGLDPQFAAFFLRTSPARREVMARMVSTAGQNTVSQGTLAAVRVPVPPPAEQRRIVEAIESHLTRLEQAEATLDRVRRNLHRCRASVLKAAVEGRLVPTEAELARAEGRDYEPASVLLARVIAERRQATEKAGHEEPVAPDLNELPRLPEGWCWASIDQLAALVRNGFSGKPAASGDVRILRISAVRSLAVDLSDARWLPGTAGDYSSDLVRSGDLLFTRYNGTPSLVGVAALVRGIDRPTVHPDKLIKVRVARADIDRSYVEIAVNTGHSRRHIERRTRTTAGQAGVSGSDIKQMPVPLPPFAEQVRIAREVERLLTLSNHSAQAVEASTARTSRLRQSVLKWAFEGRLVDQDPNDEPASILLERIRAERHSDGTTRSRGRRKKTEATPA